MQYLSSTLTPFVKMRTQTSDYSDDTDDLQIEQSKDQKIYYLRQFGGAFLVLHKSIFRFTWFSLFRYSRKSSLKTAL